jgi:uncharacterized protein with ATP-grasp and redox domains
MKALQSGARWPDPLMTSEPGSFARRTIVERKPQIINQVMADNAYAQDILGMLEDLKAEIASQQIRPLNEDAPDVRSWNQELARYAGKTWLDVPWYFAEAYFYRRLLEAVQYFQTGPTQGQDPFEKQKERQITQSVDQLAVGWGQLSQADEATAFEALLHSSLWGNRADLSNYTVRPQAHGGLAVREERGNILIDDTQRVKGLLEAGVERVAFINDNVGLELGFDLGFADFLLTQGWVHEVVFHLKNWPFFVSDAMPKDVRTTLSELRASPAPAVNGLGSRLENHLETGSLSLKEEPFWTTSLMFFEMPPWLYMQLVAADLIIVKGDVNYRRLLGDRHWPYTSRLEDVTAYFPIPVLVLRTLKGEIIVGLKAGQAEALAEQDPAWLINGKRGIIQLVTRRTDKAIVL